MTSPRPNSRQQPQPQPALMHRQEAAAIARGEHRDPHQVLGPHLEDGVCTVRALRPLARSVSVELSTGKKYPLTHETEGIFTGAWPSHDLPDYRITTTYEDGSTTTTADGFRYLPTLGPLDLHLIGEGRHENLWKVLGAHPRTYPSIMGAVSGVSFAVWAPYARAVRVIGDFNNWDGTTAPMRALGGSGVWEIFLPNIALGSAYKYEIWGADGHWRTKADPLARLAETAPATASRITDSTYEWTDSQWMQQRARSHPHFGPMSIYEVHPGSWRQGLSWDDMADQLVEYLADLGFTHVEFMPVMDHPYPPSWGYHVTSYYAPNSRFGSPDDFKALINAFHERGIGVILDWVPGHFATDEWALARFDGSPTYEHPDPQKGFHPEWGSFIFDYGRPQVRNFLVANACYWLEEFHIDGLRVDGVASMLYLDYARNDGEWTPNIHGGHENLEAIALLQEANATAYRRSGGIVMIAEESTSWPGVTAPTDQEGLGFGLKWNMGWMHDSLGYLAREPIYRQHHHHDLTFSLVYAFNEQFLLPLSHDEVVHGKGSLLRKIPGDRWQQLATLRAYLAFMWAHPGKQLLFMGDEFAQESEWADGRSLDWWLLEQPAHFGMHFLVKELNRIYQEYPALWELDHSREGFTWLNADNAADNTVSWMRLGSKPDQYGGHLVSVTNFSAEHHWGMRVGLPIGGVWRQVLNTNSSAFGGTGDAVSDVVSATATPQDGQTYSALVDIPALATVWLAPENH